MWDAVFETNLANSPDPARSKREWKLLKKYASEHPEFFAGTVFAEMPFFWRMYEQKCLEGLIDLALFRPDEKKWFVLDWKTNRVERDALENLRVEYRPQIAAYWKAVTEMTKQQVGGGIFSTATGQLIIFDQTELAKEWQRLRNVTGIEAILRSRVPPG
jgi:ATP-dependent exoDNAse (exonuclease V) beta subunit